MQMFFAQTSTVTIFSEEGEKFYVIVNGVRQNDAPGTNVVVTDLDKPNYLFKVIFEDQTINSINQNVYLEGVDGRANVTMILKKNKKGKMDMKLSSFDYDTKANPAKNTQVIKYHTVENPLTNDKKPVNDDTFSEKVDINMMGVNVNTDIKDDGENVDFNMNLGGINTGVIVTTTTTQTTTTTTNSTTTKPVKKPTKQGENIEEIEETRKPVSLPTSNNRSCRVPMNATSFQAAKTSVSKQSFSETKMKTAKLVLNANCLSTAQIVEIMGLFSFEGDKLEFAKSAYDKCTDKGNYFMVNDAFTFSASVDELTEFIEGLNY
jgi:hypothetical protein